LGCVSENGNAPAPVSKRASTGLYVRALPGLRLRDKKVERLARKVRGLMAWLEPSDAPAVRAWCELEILSEQVYAALRALGVLNSKGEGKRLLDDYRKLRATQAIFSRELGMTPAARMALKATGTRAAFDIAGAMARANAEDADTGQE
jgi:hypothetical protein